jgi:hypothetical protein
MLTGGTGRRGSRGFPLPVHAESHDYAVGDARVRQTDVEHPAAPSDALGDEAVDPDVSVRRADLGRAIRAVRPRHPIARCFGDGTGGLSVPDGTGAVPLQHGLRAHGVAGGQLDLGP